MSEYCMLSSAQLKAAQNSSKPLVQKALRERENYSKDSYRQCCKDRYIQEHIKPCFDKESNKCYQFNSNIIHEHPFTNE